MSYPTKGNQRGYIYIIVCGEYQKIGQSTSPMQRLSNVITNNPYPARLAAVLRTDNMNTAEYYLHQRYQNHLHRGEWFQLPDTELTWLLTVTDIDTLVTAEQQESQQNTWTNTVTNGAISPEIPEIIRNLTEQGWGKTKVIETLFNTKRGGSERWKTLSAAYDQLMSETKTTVGS